MGGFTDFDSCDVIAEIYDSFSISAGYKRFRNSSNAYGSEGRGFEFLEAHHKKTRT
jgi:hypothetical protein